MLGRQSNTSVSLNPRDGYDKMDADELERVLMGMEEAISDHNTSPTDYKPLISEMANPTLKEVLLQESAWEPQDRSELRIQQTLEL